MGTHDLKVWLQVTGRAMRPVRRGARQYPTACRSRILTLQWCRTAQPCLQARGADLRGAIERSDLIDIAKKLPPEGGAQGGGAAAQ